MTRKAKLGGSVDVPVAVPRQWQDTSSAKGSVYPVDASGGPSNQANIEQIKQGECRYELERIQTKFGCLN
jgi:hypothetical protein